MHYLTSVPENVWLTVMLKLGRPKPSGFRPDRMVGRWSVGGDLDTPSAVKGYKQIADSRKC